MCLTGVCDYTNAGLTCNLDIRDDSQASADTSLKRGLSVYCHTSLGANWLVHLIYFEVKSFEETHVPA